MQQTGNHEAEMYEAVHAYVFRDHPGANRAPEYNETRVQFRMHEETSESARRHVQRLQKLIAPPARVLELGCGTGGWCAAMALAGYSVVGIDIDEDGIRAAKARALRYPETSQEYQIARGESLPFPDGSFDAVVSTQVCEHVADRAGFARECARVLRPGGVALHMMPNYMFPWEPHYRMPWPPRASRAVSRLWLRINRRDTRLFDEEIFPTFPKQVVRAFREAGMVDVRNAYADEVAAKFDQGTFSRGWLTSTVRALRPLGVVRALRGIVLKLELYDGITLTARKP